MHTLTVDEIIDLSAAEIDVLVAELEGEEYTSEPSSGSMVPAYSTDINRALKLAEKYELVLSCKAGVWTASKDDVFFDAISTNLPLAISKLVLMISLARKERPRGHHHVYEHDPSAGICFCDDCVAKRLYGEAPGIGEPK